MGRYSTVQAYADNNTNMRSVSYQQATGSSEVKKGGVKAEKVSNPYGSTAGAGSGEFHVYRHARARELQRWKTLDEREQQETLEREHEEKLAEFETEEHERTEKRRKKRQRQKDAKMRKKNLELSGVVTANSNNSSNKKAEGDDEEFTYTPVEQLEEKKGDEAEEDSKPAAKSNQPSLEIPNDGSFLEKMKKQMAEQQAAGGTPLDQEEKKASSGDEKEPPKKRQAL
jgi:hypothetical protein